MLATPAVEQNGFDLFCLGLTMIGRGDTDMPAPLKAHLVAVITQAMTLAENPDRIEGALLPEAIQLALEIRDGGQLSAIIKKLGSPQSITPALANEILHDVESSVACYR